MGSQDLQQARYDQLVRRVGALYGGGSKVVEVLPEVFPVLELENTTPELIALSGWRTAWQSTERSAVVGEVSTSQLLNPADSGLIGVLTSIWISCLTSSVVQMQVTNSLLPLPSISGLFRDARFGVPRSTTLQVRSTDDVPIGGGGRFSLQDNVILKLSDSNGIAVLTPGSEFSISTVSSNIRMTITYFWRERAAQESELNFP